MTVGQISVAQMITSFVPRYLSVRRTHIYEDTCLSIPTMSNTKIISSLELFSNDLQPNEAAKSVEGRSDDIENSILAHGEPRNYEPKYAKGNTKRKIGNIISRDLEPKWLRSHLGPSECWSSNHSGSHLRDDSSTSANSSIVRRSQNNCGVLRISAAFVRTAAC